MAFRSVSVNSAQNTALVVTPPAGIQDGDILIAWGWSDDAGTTFTWPSGFVALTGTPVSTTADGMRSGCALKVAASESGNYTITTDTGCIGGIGAWSGRNQNTTPHRSSTNDQDVAQPTPWSITSAAFSSNTASTCDLVLIVGSDIQTTPGDVDHDPASSGMTERADQFDTAGSGFVNGAVYTLDGVSSGADGIKTVTGALATVSAGWSAIMIALADAAAGGSAPMFRGA